MDTKKTLAIIILLIVFIPFMIVKWQAIQDPKVCKNLICDENRMAKVVCHNENGIRTCSINLKNVTHQSFTQCPRRRLCRQVFLLDGGGTLSPPRTGFLGILMRRLGDLSFPMFRMASKTELKESSTPQPDPSDDSSAPQNTTSEPPSSAHADEVLPLNRGETLRCPRAGFFESILGRPSCPKPGMASKPELKESSTPQPNSSDDSSAPQELTSQPPSGANSDEVLPLIGGEKLRCPRAGFFESILGRPSCPKPGLASKPELKESSTPQPDPRDDSSAPREATSQPPSGANAESQPLDPLTRLASYIIVLTTVGGCLVAAELISSCVCWIRTLPHEMFQHHSH